jgi:hypothetical protein
VRRVGILELEPSPHQTSSNEVKSGAVKIDLAFGVENDANVSGGIGIDDFVKLAGHFLELDEVGESRASAPFNSQAEKVGLLILDLLEASHFVDGGFGEGDHGVLLYDVFDWS